MSSTLNVQSVQAVSGVLAIQTTTPHGLTIGKGVSTTGIVTPVGISTITRVGNILRIVTTVDHDLTGKVAVNLTIQNCSVSEFNGSHKVQQIENRRAIRVEYTAPVVATSATDGEIIHAERYDQSYNGLFQVSSVLDSTSFTVSSPNSIDGSTAVGGIVQYDIAISGAATYEIAKEAFTAQPRDKGFIAVVLGQTVASKSRINNSDLTAVIDRGYFFRQQNQKMINIYYMANPNDEIGVRATRDDMEDIALALNKTLLFHEFTNQTVYGRGHPLVFVQHGIMEYDGSYYAHEFVFEADEELSFGDTSGYSNDVAFRDISMFLDPNLSASTITDGTVTADASINLDEVPL